MMRFSNLYSSIVSSWRRWSLAGGAVGLVAVFFLVWPLFAQDGPASAAANETAELWIEVRDERGRAIRDLDGSALEIVEDGRPAAVVDVVRGPSSLPRLTLYFDALLTSTGGYRRGAEVLAGEAEALTALGEVDLVIADPEPRSVLTTRDGLALGERLGWLGSSDRGRQAILALRDETLRALRPRPGLAAMTPEETAELVARAIEEELELVAAQQERLLAHVARSAARDGGPRVLLLVSDGFDLDPAAFYAERLDPEAARRVLLDRPGGSPLESLLRDVARALAASGWTVMPLAIEPGGLRLPERALEDLTVANPRGDERGAFPGNVRKPQITLGGKKRDPVENAAEEPPAVFLAAAEPLERLAEASGGEVVASAVGLRDAVARLAGRHAVRYHSRLSAAAGLRPLEVKARSAGTMVRARRWASRATPAPIVAARLGEILAGAGESAEDGGFDVAAAWLATGASPDPGEGAGEGLAGELEARLSVRELAPAELAGLDSASLRISAGWRRADGTLGLHQAMVDDQDLRALDDWRYRGELELPADAGEVAVMIESLEDGRWGGALASVVRADRVAVEATATPRPTVIEVLRPEEDLLRGRVRFTTRVHDRRVERVAFLLDEEEVARVEERPFAARLDLGRSLRRRELTVVAYDGGGVELGRNTVLLNAGSGGLEVRITEPGERKVSGPVEVAAEVSVPLERRLDRVLFFWNNEQLSTHFAPPFRQRLVVPEDRAGYVRVMAMLDDGSVAEDVIFLNGPEAGERVDVDLVELYVVVTDEEGRPMRGLGKDDFVVREDGRPQAIAAFSDAGDLPLTIGMAIDSSASMFVKLPAVQKAAVRFLESTLGDGDRAFVVDFDSRPRLARSTTGELPRVVQAIEGLEPSGRTALWESIVFSLVQLQGVRGRKALIVFSDGADEDDEFPYTACLKLAKRMGVPIYLILMKKAPEKKNAGAFSLWTRSFTTRADKLVSAVGGRTYYAKEYRTLDAIYEEIERELRSQYLLAYYPQPIERGLWRDVDVDVNRKGLRTRTLSGYWQ